MFPNPTFRIFSRNAVLKVLRRIKMERKGSEGELPVIPQSHLNNSGSFSKVSTNFEKITFHHVKIWRNLQMSVSKSK